MNKRIKGKVSSILEEQLNVEQGFFIGTLVDKELNFIDNILLSIRDHIKDEKKQYNAKKKFLIEEENKELIINLSQPSQPNFLLLCEAYLTEEFDFLIISFLFKSVALFDKILKVYYVNLDKLEYKDNVIMLILLKFIPHMPVNLLRLQIMREEKSFMVVEKEIEILEEEIRNVNYELTRNIKLISLLDVGFSYPYYFSIESLLLKKNELKKKKSSN